MPIYFQNFHSFFLFSDPILLALCCFYGADIQSPFAARSTFGCFPDLTEQQDGGQNGRSFLGFHTPLSSRFEILSTWIKVEYPPKLDIHSDITNWICHCIHDVLQLCRRCSYVLIYAAIVRKRNTSRTIRPELGWTNGMKRIISWFNY